MKKLSKIKLNTASMMDNSEMKEVLGGSGSITGGGPRIGCNDYHGNPANKCKVGAQCRTPEGTGTCILKENYPGPVYNCECAIGYLPEEPI